MDDSSSNIGVNELHDPDQGTLINDDDFVLDASDNELEYDQALQENQAVDDKKRSAINSIPVVPTHSVPTSDMEFDSYDHAYNFYNAYARLGGFTVRKHSHRKDRGQICWAIFTCSKEGHKVQNHKVKKRRIDTRCGCLARIIVMLNKKKGKWVVNGFNAHHNHNLHSPSKFSMHIPTMGSNYAHKELIVDKCSRVGLKAPEMIKLVSPNNDIQSVSFTKMDVFNYLKNTKSYTGIDWQGLLEYFEKNNLEDPNFYYAIQLDDKSQVCNCFWVDGIAREDYLYFGDVILFSTTFKNNQYEIPFTPFIGINHHHQSILLGCGLLRDDKRESFVWLLGEWLKAMGDQVPNVIFTDHDPTIKATIEEVFPNTIHRFCTWHIHQNFPKHMNSLSVQYSNFQDKWNEWFCMSESVEEFEEGWHRLVELFPNMVENEWVVDLWKHCKSWASHCSPDIFTAGMDTTQRYESMNAVFSNWFYCKMPVRMFLQRFDDMLKENRQQEKFLDFEMKNKVKPCSYDVDLVSYMQDTLTPTMFDKFQEEFGRTAICHAKLEHVDDDIKTYRVIQMRSNKKSKEYTILFTSSTTELSTCPCWLWKREGIICAHMLAVYRAECIAQIPKVYILKRWTKTAKYGDGLDRGTREPSPFGISPFLKTHIFRMKTHKCLKEALKSESSYKKALDAIDRLTQQLQTINNEECPESSNANASMVASTQGMTSGILLQDVENVQAKGCSKSFENK